MDANVIITLIICGTVLCSIGCSAIATVLVSKHVCEAAKVVFPDRQLPRLPQ